MRRIPLKTVPVICLLLDIGGVLLTDGWDRRARKRAAAHFTLPLVEIENRHHLTWDAYQAGKLTLDEYLTLTVFNQKRSFTRAKFKRFMFAQSKPHAQMIEMIARLKSQHGLKIAVVSNEGRELNAYRIHKFRLERLVDSFISSCFVQTLKPDPEIFRLALDVVQARPQQVVYIENTPMFVEIAEGLGIRSILHVNYKDTRAKLRLLGLPDSDGSIHEGI
jgi:putative hydrolase of the HAD superfamily